MRLLPSHGRKFGIKLTSGQVYRIIWVGGLVFMVSLVWVCFLGVALKCICTKPHSCARICPCTNTHTSLTLPVYVHTHTTPFAKKKMARTIVWGFPDMKMMQRMLLCSGRYGPRKTSERRSHRRSETGSKLFSVVYCASA